MTEDFLGKLLGNPRRARVLRAFTFARSEQMTAPQAAKRSGLAPRALLTEIRALEVLGILKKGKSVPAPKSAWKSSKARGKAKAEATWTFNDEFKHAKALTMFVHEVSPVQYRSILEALRKAGRVSTVVLSGNFVGDPSRPADLIVAAEGLNESRLDQVIRSLEPDFGMEIRYAAFTTPEFRYRMTVQDRLIRDTLDFPHLVLVDKTRLL